MRLCLIFFPQDADIKHAKSAFPGGRKKLLHPLMLDQKSSFNNPHGAHPRLMPQQMPGQLLTTFNKRPSRNGQVAPYRGCATIFIPLISTICLRKYFSCALISTQCTFSERTQIDGLLNCPGGVRRNGLRILHSQGEIFGWVCQKNRRKRAPEWARFFYH